MKIILINEDYEINQFHYVIINTKFIYDLGALLIVFGAKIKINLTPKKQPKLSFGLHYNQPNKLNPSIIQKIHHLLNISCNHLYATKHFLGSSN